MNNYPQYIHVPTTVPMQRFFANPHVPVNSFGFGDFLERQIGNASKTLGGVFGNQGSKITNAFGKFGINPTDAGGIVSDAAYSTIGGNYEHGTGFGKGVKGVTDFAGGLIGKVNPVLGGLVKGVGGLVGGLSNRIFGYNLNDAFINAMKNENAGRNNARFSDSDFTSLNDELSAFNFGHAADIHDVGDWGTGIGKKKVQKQADNLNRSWASSLVASTASANNSANNITKNNMNNLLMSNYAFGGPFNASFNNPFAHTGSSAVAYTLEQQNLANQQQMLGQMQDQQPQQLQIPIPFSCGGKMHCFGGRLFSGGGDMNSHGADFTNGLMYIENGGTHEQNPYQGVPMGYDSQGTPNVVEEDEVIAPKRLLGNGGDSDFVFSNRIPIPDDFAEKYRFPYGISFADAVKRFTKESREVPNDVIYENTNKKFLAEARDLQEQIKAEQEQQQMAMAQQAFQQLPPEQQQAMAQQAMQQEQMQAMQEQTPEAGMMQPGTETFQPSMGAFGGNLYGTGGYFGPVNSFAEEGDIEQWTNLNNFSTGFDPMDIWWEYQQPNVSDIFTKNIAGKSNAEVDAFLNRVNQLQAAWDAAELYGDDLSKQRISDELGALQDLAKDSGLNNIFTPDFYNKVFRNHKGTSPDTYPNFGKDRSNGGQQWLRNYGVVQPEGYDTSDWDSWVSSLNKMGIEPYLPDGAHAYRYRRIGAAADEEPTAYNKDWFSKVDQRNADNGHIVAVNPETGMVLGPDDKPKQREQASTGRYSMPWLSTAGRDLPIWEAGLARLLDDLGLGTKPDYSYADGLAALANISNGYMPVSYKPVGQYITPALFSPYQPLLDADAQYGQASRAIQDNSNGNTAMANASQVALARNAMMANGAIAETGQKFNADQRHVAADFGRTTDLSNSQGILSAAAQNAQNWAQNRNMYGYRLGEALAARKAEKDAVDAVKLNNRRMFTDAVTKKAKENMYFNMVNHHPAYGGYGMDPRTGGILYQGHFDDGTPYWGNPGQGTPSMATNPYVANQPFNFGSFLNGLFNPYA